MLSRAGVTRNQSCEECLAGMDLSEPQEVMSSPMRSGSREFAGTYRVCTKGDKFNVRGTGDELTFVIELRENDLD